MNKIRVVIADDSSLARGMLRHFLENEDNIEVVGEAANGREAVDLARELKPDLITMDLEMPVMSGMQAIDEIMHVKAVPILVVSSIADAKNALDAMRCGALEVVSKPDYSPEQATDFVAKVRLLAGVSVITRMRPRHAVAAPAEMSNSNAAPASAWGFPPITQPLHTQQLHTQLTQDYQSIFAIASSTGGPQALALILSQLPAHFPAPILIAQHISDGFAAGMAEWLSSLCKLPVRLAQEGEAIHAGCIYISPSERHLAVTPTHRLTLIERNTKDLYRPSCDVLLNSVGAVYGKNAIGIILTGMGHDGADGMATIRAAGGATLGQDEVSSIIYGMNRVAIERGSVQRILPMDQFATAMVQLAAKGLNQGQITNTELASRSA
jgi:two-component system, chemotaxis family, protein-glutamate methylesterase/glutaminase